MKTTLITAAIAVTTATAVSAENSRLGKFDDWVANYATDWPYQVCSVTTVSSDGNAINLMYGMNFAAQTREMMMQFAIRNLDNVSITSPVSDLKIEVDGKGWVFADSVWRKEGQDSLMIEWSWDGSTASDMEFLDLFGKGETASIAWDGGSSDWSLNGFDDATAAMNDCIDSMGDN